MSALQHSFSTFCCPCTVYHQQIPPHCCDSCCTVSSCPTKFCSHLMHAAQCCSAKCSLQSCAAAVFVCPQGESNLCFGFTSFRVSSRVKASCAHEILVPEVQLLSSKSKALNKTCGLQISEEKRESYAKGQHLRGADAVNADRTRAEIVSSGKLWNEFEHIHLGLMHM